jgi:hypothetical protein
MKAAAVVPDRTAVGLGGELFRYALLCAGLLFIGAAPRGAPAAETAAFIEKHCASCHDGVVKKSGLDLTKLDFSPGDSDNFRRWVQVHDRVQSGEMPPRGEPRPEAEARDAFIKSVASSLTAHERESAARDGRATQRRLNGYEYENALRDLLSAPWLQIKGQFPEDGEALRFNKIGDALDVSHVHMARYMVAADYAIRQALSVQFERPPTERRRYYARDQRTLTRMFKQSFADRQTFAVIGTTPQPDIKEGLAPLTVGDADPETRDLEAMGWVHGNYVTGFTYRWDQFRAPVAGKYRVRFSGYTLWVAPGGRNWNRASATYRPPNNFLPKFDEVSAGRTEEPITVYTRNGVMNRRVGEFDLTPEPAVYDIGEVWLLANETLVPDASRFYRSRPDDARNPLMQEDGTPAVAFRWMEVEGPLYDESTTAGYRLLFGDLPLKKVENGAPGVAIPFVPPGDRRESGRGGGQRVEPLEEVVVDIIAANPRRDAERLLRRFVERAYRRPVADGEIARFLALFDDRTQAGLSFAEAMSAAYTAVLASPAFVYLNEQPGGLDEYALATRLALFLWNSAPDEALRDRAAHGELNRPEVLRAETERLLADPKSRRFVDAFLDYWLDLRKMEDSTPSTTLYNDYYLDDALTEAALAESQLFFAEMLLRDLPAMNIVDSEFTFLNERLATHYGIPDVKGIAMRKVTLPAESPRGGFMTQASVLKVTANGTTTSPVLRGKWIMERVLGFEIPPPPSVPPVEPDIRGAVTIRQQLDQHRADASCASCHKHIDPPGFALESFDVMGAWRDRYRGVAEDKPAETGRGKNGHPFAFHYGLAVDSSGELSDGRRFADIREFKRLLRSEETTIARNLARQLVVYATGAPVRFSDRIAVEQIVEAAKPSGYGLRSLIHEIVQSELFRNK